MNKHYGKCALCGQECELTFEHIPPRAAFNSTAAKMYSAYDLLTRHGKMPWDFSGLKYNNLQRGSGLFSLCEKCNNITGTWYGDAYKDVVHKIYYALGIISQREEKIDVIRINQIYGLRFIKQVFSLFCSVNDSNTLNKYSDINLDLDYSGYPPIFKLICDAQSSLHDSIEVMDRLRRFVLDKEASGIDTHDFQLCMYLSRGSLLKQNAFTAAIDIINNSYSIVSEISSHPIGFILYLFPQNDTKLNGTDITALVNYNYNDLCSIEIPCLLRESNSWLTNDFRSKDEIEKTVQKNRKYFEENMSSESQE